MDEKNRVLSLNVLTIYGNCTFQSTFAHISFFSSQFIPCSMFSEDKLGA